MARRSSSRACLLGGGQREHGRPKGLLPCGHQRPQVAQCPPRPCLHWEGGPPRRHMGASERLLGRAHADQASVVQAVSTASRPRWARGIHGAVCKWDMLAVRHLAPGSLGARLARPSSGALPWPPRGLPVCLPLGCRALCRRCGGVPARRPSRAAQGRGLSTTPSEPPSAPSGPAPAALPLPGSSCQRGPLALSRPRQAARGGSPGHRHPLLVRD